MATLTSFSDHLPFLRRYARALTGSQAAGDDLVQATLQVLLNRQAMPGNRQGTKVQLYQLLGHIYNSGGPQSGPVGDGVATLDGKLARMTPTSRQAFLLSAMEGFSPGDGAEALGVSVEAFEALRDVAHREIAQETATKTLIIEDEVFIARDLERIVRGLGHEVIGRARTRDEAVAAARNCRPGLILSDIQLADGSSGIDAVNDILSMWETPTIFITAFPERLLTGVRPEPTFLISKPFSTDEVRIAISQVLFFDNKVHTALGRAAGANAEPADQRLRA